MVRERIEIVVTDRGTRRVKRNLSSIGVTANTSASGVNFLRKGLLALGAGITIRGLSRTADSFTQIQNSLRLVTDGTRQLNNATTELLAISNRTRTSLETNADFFRRLTLATRELGVSEERLLRITESINQAIQISGTTTKEASNGLIQLSQGLSAGGLRGDELRSVLEQLPAVADVISKRLGVTRGELRAIGAEFRITSDVIVAGFEDARAELETRFAKVVPTIGQSLTVLNNSFTVTLGRLNETIGVTSVLSRAIIGLALNLDKLIGTVVTLGSVFIGLKLGRIIQGFANTRAAALATNLAISQGNAIAIVGAQADTARAAAAGASAIADQAKTAATLKTAQADVFRIKTLGSMTANTEGLTAATARLTAAENANATATARLAATQKAYRTSLVASSASTTIFTRATQLARTAVMGLTTALLRNPLTALTVVIAGVVGLLFSMRNEIRFGTSQIATLGDVAAVAWERVTTGIGSVLNAFGNLFGRLAGLAPDWLKGLEFSFENFLRFIAVGLDTLFGLFVGVRRFLEQLGSSITKTFKSLGVTLSFFFDNIARAAKQAFEGDFTDASATVESAFTNLGSGISDSFNALGTGAGDAFLEGLDESKLFETALDDTISAAEQNRLQALRDRLGSETGGAGGGPSGGAVDIAIEKLRAQGALLALNNIERTREQDLLTIIEKLRAQGVKVSEEQTAALREQLIVNEQIATTQAFDKTISDLQQQQVLLQQSNVEQGIQNTLLQLRNQIAGEGGTLTPDREAQLLALVTENAALERQAQILQEINGPLEAYRIGLADLEALLARNAISQEQFNRKVADLKIAALDSSVAIGDGFERGFLKARKNLEDFASTAESAVSNAFSNAEDALVKFARTGELSFQGLIDGILDDLARLASQQLLLSLVGGPGATEAGGLLSGLFKAAGGSVSSNQPQVVGERGPEIFNPPGPGNIIPASQTADIMARSGPPQPPPQVNLKVVNVQSEEEMLDAIDSPEGEQRILNVVRKNKTTIKNDLA